MVEAFDEIRPLNSQVDLLSIKKLTLGPLGDNQVIDDLTDVEEKIFMHQYNFPSNSLSKIGKLFFSERALLQIMPFKEEFP